MGLSWSEGIRAGLEELGVESGWLLRVLSWFGGMRVGFERSELAGGMLGWFGEV